ncbi:MAG: PAS domain-containing protein [Burkholderiales bacterium]|nr:PAS domain-containing protein [Burkholderiales bacterium]
MFRGLKSFLPGSLGLRVFSLYALSLDDAEAAATTLSQVMVQTIADSAVIGDYDTIEKTLRKALSRSPFDSAAFIDMKGGRIQVAAPKMAIDSQPPEWVVRRVAERLEPINTIISAGGRDYGVLRLIFASERVAGEVWDLLRASLLVGLGGLAFGLAVIGIPVFRWMRNLKRIDAFEAEIRDGRIDPTRVIDPDAPIEIRRAFDVLTRTAATLQAQREKADVTLHAVADGVLTLDAQGIVVYANPAAAATLARPAVALLGAPIADLLPDPSRQERVSLPAMCWPVTTSPRRTAWICACAKNLPVGSRRWSLCALCCSGWCRLRAERPSNATATTSQRSLKCCRSSCVSGRRAVARWCGPSWMPRPPIAPRASFSPI